jgi:hypothetical protein
VKRSIKRVVGWGVVVVVLGLGITALLAYRRVQAVPVWYRQMMNPEQIDRAAQRAEDKLIESRNWAGAIAAAEARASRGNTRPSPMPVAEEFSVRVSDEELNAFFLKWARLNGWDRQINQYVADPVVATHDGAIVLAGKMKDLGGVLLSMHFKPVLEGDKFAMRLVRVTGGQLDLPTSKAQEQLDKMKGPLGEATDRWRRDARLDSKGQANSALTLAALGRVAMSILTREPVEAVAFLPVDDRRSVPVRLTRVNVVDGHIEVAARPVPAEERAGVVERLKAGK